MARLFGDDPRPVRVAGIEADNVAEVAGKVRSDLRPAFSCVVTAVGATMILLIQPAGHERMCPQAVDALAGLRVRVREEVGPDSPVDRRPASSLVFRPVAATGRQGDIKPRSVSWIRLNGM